MFILFFQLSGSFDPTTWPAGWVLIALVAFAWFLTKLAEGISSIKTIKQEGWAAIRALFITPRRAAAEDRRAMKESIDAVTQSCAGLTADFAELRAQNSEILHEVKPNGGKSLRDEVATIGEKVEDTSAWVHHTKETSDTPIFVLDAKGNLTFANCAFRELVYAEESELKYKGYLSRVAINDRKVLESEIDDAIRNKTGFDVPRMHFKREGPNYAPIRLQATPNVGHGGVLKNFWGTASKENAEEAIHMSQA